jgi:hypothetical protein
MCSKSAPVGKNDESAISISEQDLIVALRGSQLFLGNEMGGHLLPAVKEELTVNSYRGGAVGRFVDEIPPWPGIR